MNPERISNCTVPDRKNQPQVGKTLCCRTRQKDTSHREKFNQDCETGKNKQKEKSSRTAGSREENTWWKDGCIMN